MSDSHEEKKPKSLPMRKTPSSNTENSKSRTKNNVVHRGRLSPVRRVNPVGKSSSSSSSSVEETPIAEPELVKKEDVSSVTTKTEPIKIKEKHKDRVEKKYHILETFYNNSLILYKVLDDFDNELYIINDKIDEIEDNEIPDNYKISETVRSETYDIFKGLIDGIVITSTNGTIHLIINTLSMTPPYKEIIYREGQGDKLNYIELSPLIKLSNIDTQEQKYTLETICKLMSKQFEWNIRLLTMIKENLSDILEDMEVFNSTMQEENTKLDKKLAILKMELVGNNQTVKRNKKALRTRQGIETEIGNKMMHKKILLKRLLNMTMYYDVICNMSNSLKL